jgi:polar amino acid transport system permease protein
MSRHFTSGDFLFLLRGLEWTVALSLIAFVGGALIGLPLALARVSPIRLLRYAAYGYIRLLQGIPLLVLLFLALFMPGLYGWQIDPLTAASVALSLNAAAFLGEIWRGSIESVPSGQWEAAQVLGLHRFHCLIFIIYPQALRISVPPTVGFLVQMIKATSLAAIIGFAELTRSGQLIINSTHQPFLVFLIIAVLYFALCWPLSTAASSLERRLLR